MNRNPRMKLVIAHQLAVRITKLVKGDVPSLIARAFHNEYSEDVTMHGSPIDTAGVSIDGLISLLASTTLYEPSAASLIDHARFILTNGPTLSMDIPLRPDEDLPTTLHTLLQGTVWACLMAGGADPDLYDREFHKRYSPQAKCLWFMCKKFRFAYMVAEKDGYYKHQNEDHYRLYAGRLYSRGDNEYRETGVVTEDTMVHCYRRVRIPPVVRLHPAGYNVIALTPAGIYGFGENLHSSLGVGPVHRVFPTRIRFPDAPKVAEAEASLPPWHKHELVTNLFIPVGYGRDQACFVEYTMLVTTAGTVAAGHNDRGHLSTGPEKVVPFFRPVPLPLGFTPHAMLGYYDRRGLEQGQRLLLTGANDVGQLGLGHRSEVRGFSEVPFPVDHAWFSIYPYNYSLLLSRGVFLYAGRVSPLGAAVLEHGVGQRAIQPAAMELPYKVSAAFIQAADLWVFIRHDGHGSFGLAMADDAVTCFSLPHDVDAVRACSHISHQYWLHGPDGWSAFGSNHSGQLGVEGAGPVVLQPTPVKNTTVAFRTACELVRIAL
ncbi:chromatin binding protein [Carpediemonas membranifera]|uniref:Chromatin binding protein n=1 Tax=Carpediemonas membranifera TaxID=201153 RepID=A0A8J6E6J6_9EUKA|nr:chromatin binding protein [Carpediemonas membranifera]|eukprot:KAG9397192.1 chromatin binding protein [Carpediemonas membranifera]